MSSQDSSVFQNHIHLLELSSFPSLSEAPCMPSFLPIRHSLPVSFLVFYFPSNKQFFECLLCIRLYALALLLFKNFKKLFWLCWVFVAVRAFL